VNPERAAPGRWLRLTALAASAACLLAVVSGASGGAAPHRLLAVLGLPPLVALVAAALAAHPPLRGPSLLALGLYGAAALTGGQPTAHLVLAGLALAATLVVAAATFRGTPMPSGPWRDYLALTEPRIMSLLLVTGFFAMLAGERGLPPLATVVALVGGLGLACGGASALNHVLDRDIDRLMGKRTADRPVASGRVPASHALEFGLSLNAFSFTLLATLANLLAAALALAGGLFYVLVYTRWLKRSTPQNIVIGGAAGAMPPLVGWAAATGKLSLTALALFAIIFL
jgi:protoheme IX farnesyltransferase